MQGPDGGNIRFRYASAFAFRRNESRSLRLMSPSRVNSGTSCSSARHRRRGRTVGRAFNLPKKSAAISGGLGGGSLETVEHASTTNLLICFILGASGLHCTALVAMRQRLFENTVARWMKPRLLRRGGAP